MSDAVHDTCSDCVTQVAHNKPTAKVEDNPDIQQLVPQVGLQQCATGASQVLQYTQASSGNLEVVILKQLDNKINEFWQLL